MKQEWIVPMGRGLESSIRKCRRAGLAIENDRVTERSCFNCAQRLVQQIVGRERRSVFRK